jgi:metallophosphoesterase superfamily enzyme
MFDTGDFAVNPKFMLAQANTCEVIYVPGNHDEAVRSFLTRYSFWE